MRKYLLLAILLILSTMAVAPTYHAYRYAHVYGKSVVRLFGTQSHGGGTGFLVSHMKHTYILTNDHVCGMADENGRILVDSPFTELQFTHIIAHSKDADLCVLAPIHGLPALTLSKREFRRHEGITVLGHPRLGALYPSHGRIIRTSMADVPIKFIQTDEDMKACSLPKNRIIHNILFGDMCSLHVRAQETTAHVQPGNSGSPVLDDSGHVAGVVFAGTRSGNESDIVPLKEIRRFLTSVVRHRNDPPPPLPSVPPSPPAPNAH
jgi:serine protease Do